MTTSRADSTSTADVKSRLGRFQNLTRRTANRSLKTTIEGRVLLVITILSGLAAINTGNNLLYFGWGFLLASIVISGVMSEATLQSLRVTVDKAPEVRALAPNLLPIFLENTSRRLAAFGINVEADYDDAVVRTPPLLRLGAGERVRTVLSFSPPHRGRYTLKEVRAITGFPFGFFIKTRYFSRRHAHDVVVYPARLSLRPITMLFASRAGVIPSQMVGPGDDFFSLRPFRDGDDMRQVYWRRAAQAGRLVVRETERHSARDIHVVFAFTSTTSDDDVERHIAAAGSLCEDLLAGGFSVGLSTHGVSLKSRHGGAQRERILTSLALLDRSLPLGECPDDARTTTLSFAGCAPFRTDVLIPLTDLVEVGSARYPS